MRKCRGCRVFRIHIKVGVDVGGRFHTAVPKPHLNGFHVGIRLYEERCTGVTKVVEADTAHSQFIEKEAEVGGDIIGTDKVAHGIHAYHVKVFGGVGFSELLSVLLLAYPMLFQGFRHHRHHGYDSS